MVLSTERGRKTTKCLMAYVEKQRGRIWRKLKQRLLFWSVVGLEPSTMENQLKEYVKETSSMELPHDRQDEWFCKNILKEKREELKI